MKATDEHAEQKYGYHIGMYGNDAHKDGNTES